MGRIQHRRYEPHVFLCEIIQRRHFEVGRVGSEGHGQHVPRREVVRPRPLELGRIKRDQHGLHVLGCGGLQKQTLWGCLGALNGTQKRYVCRIVWVDTGDGVRGVHSNQPCVRYYLTLNPNPDPNTQFILNQTLTRSSFSKEQLIPTLTLLRTLTLA